MMNRDLFTPVFDLLPNSASAFPLASSTGPWCNSSRPEDCVTHRFGQSSACCLQSRIL
jgi:hypothetical protein